MEKKFLVSLIIVAVMVMGTFSFIISGYNPKGKYVKTPYLRLGTLKELKSPDPAKADVITLSATIYHNIAENLVTFKGDGDMVAPELAKNWSVDDKTYTFNLKKDAKFSDGSKVTSEDVKFSIERTKQLQDSRIPLLDNVEKIETPDNSTVKITLDEESAIFLPKLATPHASIISSENYPKTELGNTFPVTSGPYVVTSMSSDKIILENNKNYWKEAPSKKKISITNFETQEDLKQSLINNETDMTLNYLDTETGEIFRKSEKIQTKETIGSNIRFITLNTAKEPLTDKKVRKAISLLTNRTQIVNKIYNGKAEPLYSLIPGSLNESVPVFRTNMTREEAEKEAESLLNEAGYSEDKIDIDIVYIPEVYSNREVEMVREFEKMLEDTGKINVNPVIQDYEDFLENKGKMRDMYMLSWFPDYYDPDNYIYSFLNSNRSTLFKTFYADEEMNSLLKMQRKETNHEERKKVLKEIQEKLAEDTPYIPLLQQPNVIAFQNKIDRETIVQSHIGLMEWNSIKKTRE